MRLECLFLLSILVNGAFSSSLYNDGQKFNLDRGENTTSSSVIYSEVTSSMISSVHPTSQSVFMPRSFSEPWVSTSAHSSVQSFKSSSLEHRSTQTLRSTMTSSVSRVLSTSHTIDRESSISSTATHTSTPSYSSVHSSSRSLSLRPTPNIGDGNMAFTTTILSMIATSMMSSTSSMAVSLKPTSSSSPFTSTPTSVLLTSSHLHSTTSAGMNTQNQIGRSKIPTPTRSPSVLTSVSSSSSHTEMPPPSSSSLAPSTKQASPTTSVSVAPPTAPPTGGASFNYKLILYIVPPLLLVVVIVVCIALGLCVKRYRRIRRYRQHLVPLTDVDGSDDSDEDEELDTREPAFMVASTSLSSRPILSFDES